MLSNDFGELFNAHYFLEQTPVEARLIVPPRLWQSTGGRGPRPIAPYGSAAELAATVDAADPEVVVLCSGYLFVVNKLLRADEVEGLLDRWRGQGRRLVTSDPALGLLSGQAQRLFSTANPAGVWLAQHFRWLTAQLAEATHLYLAPPHWAAAATAGSSGPMSDRPDDLPTESLARPPSAPDRFSGPAAPLPVGRAAVSFFNPRLGATLDAPAAAAAVLSRAGLPTPADKLWLFILAPDDFAIQVARYGRQGLAERIAVRILDARRAGRTALLLAPEMCRADVARVAPEAAESTVLGALPLDEFQGLLKQAEQVFYWNEFSASILARVVWGMPFFVFDRGHLVRAMPEIHATGTRHFYAGREVDLLDFAAPLEAERLRTLADEQRAGLLAETRANLARSPLPEQVAAGWLNDNRT